MADNLRSLEERIDTDIDPNGTPGSIFAENHNAIEKEILRRENIPITFFWQQNKRRFWNFIIERERVERVTNFNVTASKLTSDLIDFGRPWRHWW
jgi:hypothetical protein